MNNSVIPTGTVQSQLKNLENCQLQEREDAPNSEAPLTGVFSTRSPNRPNPNGFHEVNIIAITGNIITVSALEIIDGTPVIDIKPVIV